MSFAAASLQPPPSLLRRCTGKQSRPVTVTLPVPRGVGGGGVGGGRSSGNARFAGQHDGATDRQTDRLITASPDCGPDAAWPTRLRTYGCASSWRRQLEPELGREQWSHIQSKHQPCVGWISPVVSVSIYVYGDGDAISMPAGFRRHPVGKTLIVNVFAVISLTYVSLAS